MLIGQILLNLLCGIFTKQKIIMNGFNSGIILEKLITEVASKKNIYYITDISFPLFIPSVDLHTRSNLYFFFNKK